MVHIRNRRSQEAVRWYVLTLPTAVGLLSLEEAATDLEEPFLKKGILLIVDGTDPELVRAIMETELVSVEGRHKETIGFWDTLAAMGPAWGMIGTLIGSHNSCGKVFPKHHR